jgi:hypothetical protein
MEIGEYFILLEYAMMVSTFIVLALVFLHVFYGEEQKEEQ